MFYLTDNDWVTAAKVIPREEFLARVGSFYQNYAVISALTLTLSMSSLWYVPLYQDSGQRDTDFWLSMYACWRSRFLASHFCLA